MDAHFTVRAVVHENLNEILELQKLSYRKEYWETKETFETMLNVYPKGCRVVFVDSKAVGYLFFHPSLEGKIQKLNYTSLKLTGKEDCMYLHDLSIHPDYRGKGITKFLLNYLNESTKEEGLHKQMLISVQDSVLFWEKNGFEKVEFIKDYGGLPAYYMIKSLKY